MKKKIILAAIVLLVILAIALSGKKEPESTDPNLFVLKDLNITAVNITPYEGLYLEAGEAETVSGVYAMTFTNTGSKTIREAQLVFTDGKQELYFRFEMLAAGQTVTVAEMEKCAVTADTVLFVDGTVAYLEDGLEKTGVVEITTDASGAMTVRNTTEEWLPLIRIFYRGTDTAGNALGGPCRSALIDGLEPGASFQPEAEGWDATCAVAAVLVVNE